MNYSILSSTSYADVVVNLISAAEAYRATSAPTGTLFQNKATGEMVISFRSTEFIEEEARPGASRTASRYGRSSLCAQQPRLGERAL